MKETIIDRFFKYVEQIPESTCWYWIGGAGRYGVFSITHERSISVHVFSYMIHKGDIPKGICVCHTCDEKLCVNPNHLFLGTHGDNAKDRNKKGRHNFGENRPMAKLTEEQVKYIKQSNETNSVLGEQFNVSATAIYHIRKNINWKHV
jgi:hypothetical protein